MAEVKLKGVKRRTDTGAIYFEQRVGQYGKVFSMKIDSPVVGALCHDIAHRYIEERNRGNGRKRKATTTLNYPEYSSSLSLQPLPKACGKEVLMEIILNQARAAANYLNQDVGSQSPNKRSTTHHTVLVKPSGVVEGKQDLPESRFAEALEVLQKIPELFIELRHSLIQKVNERKELEYLVAGVKNSGYICLPEPVPDNFQDQLARLNPLCSAEISWLIEVVAQEYNSEEFKCRKLREKVQDHNSKSIPESLMRDGDMRGRQRADESVRLPTVIETCSSDEHRAGSVFDGVSNCLDPASFPVDIEPCETDTTMPPVEMERSQHVALYDESAPDYNAKSTPVSLMTGRQRADENGRHLESRSRNEQKAGSVCDGVSKCRGPASSPLEIEPCEIDSRTHPVGMDLSQHDAQYDESAPDHISKSVSVSLMGDGDLPMCQQRADERRRPSEELESSPDEPKAGSVHNDANKCSGPPASPPGDGYAYLANITTLPPVSVEMNFSQPVVIEDFFTDLLDDYPRNSLFHAGYPREYEEGSSLSWTESLFNFGEEAYLPPLGMGSFLAFDFYR